MSVVVPPEVQVAAAALVFTSSLGLMALLGLLFRHLKFPLVALFSRLQKPRLLDLETRNKIYDAIQHEPGLRAYHIQNRLGLATGATAYHLEVLTRNGLVTRAGFPVARRYYVKGSISQPAMQTHALLRSRPAARLYEEICVAPGLTVGELARRLDVSAARVSRLSRRLAQAGLISRAEQGRTTILVPAPSGATFRGARQIV